MGGDRAAIVAEGLTIRFGDRAAVDGMDLSVPEGVVFGFLGTNGAGKTTTMRLLLGLLEPTSGRASVAGFDTRTQGDEVRAQCGVLLDEPGLYDRLSAEQNLELYARIWGLPPADRAARIKDLLTHIGLWDRRKETVDTWSLGMRKKLALARAVLHRPPVLFLDEPTTGLDPIARAALRADIISLAEKEGATVFLTTHDLDDAQRMCTLVGVMRAGRLMATGSLDDLNARYQSSDVEIRGRGLRSPLVDAIRRYEGVVSVDGEHDGSRLRISLQSGVSVAPLVQLAVQQGAQIEEVRPEHTSLEDAFLAIVATGSP